MGFSGYSSCYIEGVGLELAEIAAQSDRDVRAARARLVAAVRQAAAGGMTQQQIAAEIGRSQPEVSRLLRFHGATPLGRRLRAARTPVLRAIADAGGSQVRVFGSVATEQEGPDSDIDLVFTMGTPLSLMELERMQRRLCDILGADVDLVPDTALRPDLRDRVLAEAVPL